MQMRIMLMHVAACAHVLRAHELGCVIVLGSLLSACYMHAGFLAACNGCQLQWMQAVAAALMHACITTAGRPALVVGASFM